MGKLITSTKLSETLNLSECSDGYWLWDEMRRMNLSMKARTPTDAFVEALHFYQNRLTDVEQKYSDLKGKVDTFIKQFVDEE